MDEVSALSYVVAPPHDAVLIADRALMPTPTSPRQDVPTSSMPVPTPTHPVAGRSITDDAPSFDWTPVPDADTYRLQLAATDAFETIYHEATVDGPTAVSLADALPDDASGVVWRVRAETGPEAPWSTPARFDVSGAADDAGEFRVDAPPVPIHPIEGDAVDARAAAFTWESVPEAGGYQLQVGRTESFDDPLVDLPFDQTTSLTLFEMLPTEESPLYWRVRSLFPNDTEGPWSDTAVFGTDETRTDMENQADTPAAASEPSASGSPSLKTSPLAAGPAQNARTSSAMAMTFTLVLVVSFVATILAIMWVS